MKNKKFFGALTAAALLFLAALGSGGCGGSSSGGGANPVPEESSATRPETTFNLSDVSALLTMDIDGNGMPDFLDFYGVAQVHVDNSASSVRLSGAPTLLAAAEKTVMVPSMIWLSQLRLETEGARVSARRRTSRTCIL